MIELCLNHVQAGVALWLVTQFAVTAISGFEKLWIPEFIRDRSPLPLQVRYTFHFKLVTFQKMPTDNEKDENGPVETIPLEESTRRPADLPNNVEPSAGPRNTSDNIGVDDGLLGSGNGGGPTGPKPHPAGPDAIEPGEFDVEDPEIGDRGGEQPRPEPRPRPRPQNPVTNKSIRIFKYFYVS